MLRVNGKIGHTTLDFEVGNGLNQTNPMATIASDNRVSFFILSVYFKVVK